MLSGGSGLFQEQGVWSKNWDAACESIVNDHPKRSFTKPTFSGPVFGVEFKKNIGKGGRECFSMIRGFFPKAGMQHANKLTMVTKENFTRPNLSLVQNSNLNVDQAGEVAFSSFSRSCRKLGCSLWMSCK